MELAHEITSDHLRGPPAHCEAGLLRDERDGTGWMCDAVCPCSALAGVI